MSGLQQHTLLEYDYVYVPSSNNSEVTLLLLHGTGGDERSLLDTGKRLHPDAHLLSPRGNVPEGQCSRFFERLSEGVFNEVDIVKRAKDLSDFIVAAKKKHTLEHTAVVAVGFSNGANIAASILLLHPVVLKGAVLLRAMLPLTPKQSVRMKNVQVLMLSGTSDRMMPESKAKDLAELLSSRGASVRHEWLHAGHALTPQDIKITAQWLIDNF